MSKKLNPTGHHYRRIFHGSEIPFKIPQPYSGLAFSLFLPLRSFYFSIFIPEKKGAAAEISCSGQVTQVLDLSKNQEVTIQTPNGGTNQLIVKDGEIWCYDASCPDKLA